MAFKKLFQYLVASAVAAVLITGSALYYHHRTLYPSTDDAYVHAHIVYISPEVSGQIAKLYVESYQHVEKGQELFAINPKPFLIALASAKANLKQTALQLKAAQSTVAAAKSKLAASQARLYSIKKNTQRTLSLVKQHYSSASAGDNAISSLGVAKADVAAAQSYLHEAERNLAVIKNAKIEAAKAKVASAQLNLSYTTIRAPSAGYIADFNLRIGADVSAYQPLFTIVENQQWWIKANFKETELTRLRVGQTATITLDMYPNHIFHGVIEHISHASGTTFSIMPPENATGNWVKVTQRFPVRIKITGVNTHYPLRVGASANITVNTRSHITQ